MSARICSIAAILVGLASCVISSRSASVDVAVYEWNQIALAATTTDAQDPIQIGKARLIFRLAPPADATETLATDDLPGDS